MMIPIDIKEYLTSHTRESRKKVAKHFNVSEEDIRAYRHILKAKPSVSKYDPGIVLFDIHYPEHNRACMNIAYKFTKDLQPKWFILGGDQLDFNCISIFNKGKPKLVENQRLIKDYEGFQRDILDRFEPILPSGCKKIFLIGNHDYRVERLIESDPQYEGFIEVEKNLELDDWEIIPYNHIYRLGFMNIIHGVFWNKYHSNKHLRIYGENIYYGHTHNSQSYVNQTPINNEPKEAQGVGCLCNLNPHWKRDMPNNWIHEFLFFYMRGDGIYFPYRVRIIDGVSIINDKLYEG